MTRPDLSTLLEDASENVYVGDLVDQAWAGARAHQVRRRQRVAAGVATVVAVGVLGYAISQFDGGDRADPTPAESTTTRLVGATVDGTPFTLAPDVGREVQLAQVGTRLPTEVRLDGTTETLSDRAPDPDGRKAQVRMVYLLALSDRELRPVLVTPDGSRVEVDQLTLTPTHDRDGNQGSPLATGSVTPDGRRVVFAQPGGVVVLDAFTGAVRRVEVPSDNLEDIGWTTGQTGIVASDAGASWFIDGTVYGVSALPERASPGHYRLVADAQRQRPMALQTWDAYGQQSASPVSIGHTFSDIYGDTVASLEGRAATQVFVDPVTFGASAGTYQLREAILVVDADHPATRTILAFPDQSGDRFAACCRPLAWADASRLLYLSANSKATWIMAWDTATGDVRAVTRLVGTGGTAYAMSVAVGLLN